MKTEIKFRAWDGKEMRHEYMVARPQMCNVLGVLQDENFAKSTYGVSEWALMQFTGLIDKNGKEIYEGDIVKGLDGTIDSVVFEYGCFMWEGTPMIYEPGEGFEVFDTEDWAEVIGDIYTTPELIK